MRVFLGFLVFTILFTGLTLAGIPYFVSTQDLEARLVEAVKTRTGRDLVVSGGSDLLLFPKVGVLAREVSLSNPPGMDKGTLVTMDEMRVSVKIMSLLFGGVDLDEFQLVRPDFTLLVDKTRQKNWIFEPAHAAADTPAGEEKAGTEGAAEQSGDGSNVRPRRIAVVDGKFSYIDQLTGEAREVSDINLTTTTGNGSEQIAITASALYEGEKLDADITLSSLAAFFNGQPAGLTLKLAAPPLSAEITGTVARAGDLIIEGDVMAEGPSLRKLAAWAGSPLIGDRGLGAFSTTGKINLTGQVLNLSDAKITLDGMSGEGTVSVNLEDARPAVDATLTLDSLDLNQYVAAGESAEQGGWSEAPADFAGLRALDATLALVTKRILYGEVETGRSALMVKIADGALSAELGELVLYGGTAQGTLALDGNGDAPGLALAGEIRGVEALAFLQKATGFDWVEGNANLKFDLAGRGKSERDMVASLDGEASVEFANGAVRGLDVAGMLQGLGSATLAGWDRGEAKKTDFSSLTGSFTIEDGIASIRDLQMVGPRIRLAGEGVADLPQRTLNFKLTPRVVVSLGGEGGAVDLAGLNVPIIVKGPWAEPAIYPDITGILDDPEAAYDRLRQVNDEIAKGGDRELLDPVLGSGASPRIANDEGDGSATAMQKLEEQLRKDPLKAFKKLF